MADSLQQQLEKPLDQLTRTLALTGRFGRQKLAVLGGYLLVSLLTVTWAMSSSSSLDNPIGAVVEPQVVETSGERWMMVKNDSDEEWTGVVFILNDHFVFKSPRTLAPGKSERLFAKDFLYTLYVPRAPHFGSPEATTQNPPAPHAPRDLAPRKLIIQTEQGTHAMLF